MNESDVTGLFFLKGGAMTTKEDDGQQKSSFPPFRFIQKKHTIFLSEDHRVSAAQSTQTVQDLAIVAQAASQVRNYFLLLNSARRCYGRRL